MEDRAHTWQDRIAHPLRSTNACAGATSIIGNAISVEDEEYKLRTIVETAEQVWGRLRRSSEGLSGALVGEQALYALFQASIVVEVAAPGAFGIVAEHAPGFLDGDARGIFAGEGSPYLDLVPVVLAHRSLERPAAHVIRRGDVEDLVTRQVALCGEHEGVGQVVDVDVAPDSGAKLRAVAYHGSQVTLVVALVLHPGRPDRDAPDVRAPDGAVHQEFAEILRCRVWVLGTDGVFLVYGHVIRKKGTLGEEEPWHRLAGGVHETGHSESDRRL